MAFEGDKEFVAMAREIASKANINVVDRVTLDAMMENARKLAEEASLVDEPFAFDPSP